MENATKALIITAGVLISIMILSLLIMGYNQISSYYGNKHKTSEEQQLEEFNNVYENYNRKNIRGSDLLSLMNRIIDYNERQSYQTGTNYKRIGVEIQIGNNLLSQFKYETNDGTRYGNSNQFLKATITNKVGTASHTNDEKLTEITNTEKQLIEDAKNVGISDLSSAKLQQLSANISSIIDDTNSKRPALLKSILGEDISGNTSKMNKIKEIASKYYQFTQFKRAYFECTGTKYDEKTGRICEMNFVVSTKNGVVVFN